MTTRSGQIYAPRTPSRWPRLSDYGIRKVCKCTVCSGYRETVCASEEHRIQILYPDAWMAYCNHENAAMAHFESRTAALHASYEPLPTPEQEMKTKM